MGHHKSRLDMVSKKKCNSSSSVAKTNHAPIFTKQTHLSDQRKSYYITRDVAFYPNSSTESKNAGTLSRRRMSTAINSQPYKFLRSSASAGSSVGVTIESKHTKQLDSSLDHNPGSTLEKRNFIPDTFDGMLSWSTSGRYRLENYIIKNSDEFDSIPEPDYRISLTPIINNSHNYIPKSPQVKVVKEDSMSHLYSYVKPGHSRLNSMLSKHSERMAFGQRTHGGKKSLWAESYSVMKISGDPRNDFRESMVEMILENQIRCSEDLEELLACYLSLNSNEYHDLIINVFKQIWFDLIS